jgi:hypothetical protein
MGGRQYGSKETQDHLPSHRASLRLSDLDNAKSAVLNSLTSSSSRRVYEHAIEELIARYCSEPRLASNRIVVVRYRIHLEARNLAAATIKPASCSGSSAGP